MTREEAIEWIENIKEKNIRGGDEEFDEKRKTALEMAIQALEQIDKIKQIIAIDNSVIQEDVMKYKMICEVVEE